MSDLFAGINKEHLGYVLAGILIFLLGFMIYGDVQEALDENWMDFSMSHPDWKPYFVGAALIGGAVCLFLKTGGYLDKYDTWLVFGGIFLLALGGFLWWYWYQVIPAIIGMVAAGGAGLFARNNNASLPPTIKSDEKGSAPPVNVILFLAISLVLPFVMMWLVDRYDLTGTVWTWFIAIIYIIWGYAGSYIFDLHK